MIRRSRARIQHRLSPNRDADILQYWLGAEAQTRRLIGVDEAGVAALAGPVTAAAVCFPAASDIEHLALQDSKKISPKQASRLCREIVRIPGVVFHVAAIDAKHVTAYGGALSARMACLSCCIAEVRHHMERSAQSVDSVDELLHNNSSCEPLVLVDGAELPENLANANRCFGVPRGDAHFACVAAASIISKAVFEQEMMRLDLENPGWGFSAHKGYPTRGHVAKLRSSGPLSGVHRDADACARIVST